MDQVLAANGDADDDFLFDDEIAEPKGAADDDDSIPDLVDGSEAASDLPSDDGRTDDEAEADEAPEEEEDEGDDDDDLDAIGRRFVQIGRHVLLLDGGDDDPSRPLRLRLALVRSLLSAERAAASPVAMADALVREGAIRTPEIVAAFRAVDRRRFLPAELAEEAYARAPARRGVVHQSSPSVYGSALEALDLRPGLSFLNVGSGTGYLSALAHEVLGPTSVHVGVERHGSLVRDARRACAHAPSITFEVADIYDVDVNKSPKFDRVYVGAGARRDARDIVLRSVGINQWV